ncbi:MAG: hypothetical protein N4A63_02610 [Vallitalea sp.]|jgi:hypothetical protein|nr:hypothetical protein [Vallitalea sp.]
MEKNNNKKLVIVEVIKESMNLYKNNFWLLFKLNAIGVLILLVTSNFNNLRKYVDIMELNFLIGFIGIILIFVGLYYSFRVTVSLILSIKDRYVDKEVTIKEIYNRSKENIWKYIGSLLLFGLMIIIPVLFTGIGVTKVDTIILKIVFIIVGSVLLSYIMVKYRFAMYVRIFKPEINNYFRYSNKLVNNYFWEVLCILLVSFLAQLPSIIMSVLIDVNTIGLFERFIYNNITHIITLAAGPFLMGLSVIAYLKLDNE